MHSFDTAQSLLALPAEVTEPDPYRVFGLSVGERDATAIAQAIQSTIARLNAAKANADPVAWQQAAVWVKQARGVLADPVKKAQLDQTMARPAHDPLAGLLPGGAGAVPVTEPVVFRAGAARVLPPTQSVGVDSQGAGSLPTKTTATDDQPAIDPFGIDPPLPPSLSAQLATPAPAPEVSLGPAAPSADGAVLPIQVAKPENSKGRRRRQRFPWAAVSLGALTLASIAGIAGLIYVLNRNPGGITINLQSGAVDGGGTVDSDGAPGLGRPPADPVMGSIAAPERPSRRERNDAERLAAADNWLAGLGSQSQDEAAAPMGMTPEFGAEMSPEPGAPLADVAVDMTSERMSGTEPAMEMAPGAASGDAPSITEDEPTGDAEAGQQALDRARQAIAAADWATMKSLAEAAVQAAGTAEQKTRASQLLQLAELASYYHGGIEQGLAGLEAGESFAITENIQVVMVEIGPEVVVVRFSGRNKEYPRQKLPLVLAHKIATFSMAADAPETIAAGHAYQAIAPISTPPYRQQAIRALEAMTEPVEGAEPVDVAAAIRDVFAE